ncbi:MAG: hypothetical protein ACREJB_16165, partial [Planctomycetaceae bacterium]
RLRGEYGRFLDYTGGHYWNHAYPGRKYVAANDGQTTRYFYLTNDGRLFTYGGTQVAQLTAEFYADPTRLWTSGPLSAATVLVAAGRLTVTPPPGHTGSLVVLLEATDGLATSRETFTVRLIEGGSTAAADLDRDWRFFGYHPTYWEGVLLGQQEKYFAGIDPTTGQVRYLRILSSGRIDLLGSSGRYDTHLATLDPWYWEDPARLFGAAELQDELALSLAALDELFADPEGVAP